MPLKYFIERGGGGGGGVGRGERGGIVFLLQKRIYYKIHRDKTERQITATCKI